MSKTIRSFISQFYQRGSFLQNVSIFTGGSVLAFGIGFLFTPVITRIYLPEDYGAFSFFNTSTILLSSIALLGFNEALILPRKKRGFYRLSGLLLVSGLVVCALVVVIDLLIGTRIVQFFNVPQITGWTFLIPVMIMLNVVFQVAENYVVRIKKFKRNASARIVSITAAKSTVATIGLAVGSRVWGLITGEIIIRVLSIGILTGSQFRKMSRGILQQIKRKNLKQIAHEYRDYPLMIFPSTLFVKLAMNLPVFVIGRAYDAEFLGFYSLAISLLGIPVQVIGFSSGKVFLQKANETWQEVPDQLRSQIIRFYYGLLIFSLGIYGVVLGFGQEIFSIVAGDSWVTAGTIAAVIAPALALHLCSIAIGPVFRVMRKEKVQFAANFTGSLLYVILLLLPVVVNLEARDYMFVISAGIALRALIFIFFAFQVGNVKPLKHLLITLVVLVTVFYSFHLVAGLVKSLIF